MTSLRHTPYASPAWRTVRTYVLNRDHHQCQAQGPTCTVHAQAVDHIIPWADGGAWYDPTNLRAICTACNSSRANRMRAGYDHHPPTPSRAW